MNIPKIDTINSNTRAMSKILQQSKCKNTIGEQIKMSNYYAYLQSKSKNNDTNFAKLLLGL